MGNHTLYNITTILERLWERCMDLIFDPFGNVNNR